MHGSMIEEAFIGHAMRGAFCGDAAVAPYVLVDDDPLIAAIKLNQPLICGYLPQGRQFQPQQPPRITQNFCVAYSHTTNILQT
jgi:hypothetical protein